MRTIGLLLLISFAGWTQPPIVRGVLLERDTDKPSGEFSVRLPDNQVFRFLFDAKTYVESESRMIDVRRLQPGDKVEVLSDTVNGSLLHYARTIHVIADAPPPRVLTAGRLRAYHTPSERTLPSGTLTFSGVVFRLTGERLVLHTREGGDQPILLRKDTRYLENGEVVEAANLKPNMRVFIRAGKDLYDQVEAYQVIWGGILQPK